MPALFFLPWGYGIMEHPKRGAAEWSLTKTAAQAPAFRHGVERRDVSREDAMPYNEAMPEPTARSIA